MVENAQENWSDLLGFYEHAKSYFAANNFVEDTPDFLYLLMDRIKAHYGVVLINNGEESLQVIDQDKSWLSPMSDLVEYLPLLYQSCELTRIEPDKISALQKALGDDVAQKECCDLVFFAIELLDQNSLVFVMFRDTEQGAFTEREMAGIASISSLLEQLVSLAAMSGQGDQVTEQLRTHRKRELVWLESLAWLNESGSDFSDQEQLEVFYTTALFQLKMLVNATYIIAFRYSAEGSRTTLRELDESVKEQAFAKLIDRLVEEKRINRRDFLKLHLQEEPETTGFGVGVLMIYPLFVDNRLEIIYCIERDRSALDDHEEMVAALFAEGIEDFGQRVFLLRQVREQNEVLEKEKEEQAKLISQLSEAQDQLLQQEKMASIGQLAAGVAHEINNPVGYVNSNINSMETYVNDLFELVRLYEQVESELPDENAQVAKIKAMKKDIDFDFIQDDVQDLISESKEGVLRVKQIVKDLKDFSHVDEAEWQWADLTKGMDSTLNIVHNEIKYKAEIVKEYDDLPKIECVPSQINQVVMNLLVNASHAIEDRGTITMRAKRVDDKHVCIEVSDTGKGISQENLNKIFNPFFTTKPVGKGTGLGLSLSYSIAEKHDGELSVESEVGVGTTFRMTLPIEQKERKAED